MIEPDEKPEEEMSMEEALSAIRKLISEDEPLPEDAREAGEPIDDLSALDELPENEDESQADDSTSSEDDDLGDIEDLEVLELDSVDEEPLDLEPMDVEPLELAAEDLEPLDLEETSVVEMEDDFSVGDGGEHKPADVDDIPKFLTELREALGEVEQAAQDEVLPLSAEMELHQEPPDEADQLQPAAEEEAPVVIPDITEEEVQVMNQGDDRILSPEAAMKASSAFGDLSSLVTSGYQGEDNTLEGLVTAVLRPIMREWLDENLPRIVEEQVQAEIKRLAGN